MTESTLRPLVAVTDPGDNRDAWLEARASRVTASMIHDVAVGGRATWLRILDGQLNGQKFKGNASTARGHRREAFLIDYAREFIDPTIEPNALLYVHPDNDRIGATPDGIGARIGVEVKSIDHGGRRDDIPAEHYDQMQLGLYVTGRDRWLYIREVMGEDGEPTLDDPWHTWIERDESRIAYLVREAERFIAWREAGAPATDDLAAELDDALAAWADARDRKKAAESAEKAAEAVIRKHIDATEGASTQGLKLAGRAAQFVFAVTEKEVLDTDAWAEAEPKSHELWQQVKKSADEQAELAARLYHKTARSTRLNITATKETA